MMKIACRGGSAARSPCRLRPRRRPKNGPTRSVRILVGSAPGGGTDAMARAVADRLGPLLKQPVVVENRPGVSNTIAADATAKATDGHTMVMGVVTAHAHRAAPDQAQLRRQPGSVPVAFVGAVPNVLVVSNDVGGRFGKGAGRSWPGRSRAQLNFATSGAGSTQHIAAEMFKDAAGSTSRMCPTRAAGRRWST